MLSIISSMHVISVPPPCAKEFEPPPLPFDLIDASFTNSPDDKLQFDLEI